MRRRARRRREGNPTRSRRSADGTDGGAVTMRARKNRRCGALAEPLERRMMLSAATSGVIHLAGPNAADDQVVEHPVAVTRNFGPPRALLRASVHAPAGTLP